MSLRQISCQKLILVSVNLSQNKIVLLKKKWTSAPHCGTAGKFYSDQCLYSVLCDTVTSIPGVNVSGLIEMSVTYL
jgi:hypothetical protein